MFESNSSKEEKNDTFYNSIKINKKGLKFLRNGDFENAEKCFLEAIELSYSIRGNEVNTIKFSHNLGKTYVLNENLGFEEKKEKVLGLYEHTYYFISKKYGGIQFYLTFEILIGYFIEYGYYKEAYNLIINFLKNSERNSSVIDYGRILGVIKNLFNYIGMEEKFEIFKDSEPIFEKIYSIKKKPIIIEFYYDFSNLYEVNGNLEKALEVLKRLLKKLFIIEGKYDIETVLRISDLEKAIVKK